MLQANLSWLVHDLSNERFYTKTNNKFTGYYLSTFTSKLKLRCLSLVKSDVCYEIVVFTDMRHFAYLLSLILLLLQTPFNALSVSF